MKTARWLNDVACTHEGRATTFNSCKHRRLHAPCNQRYVQGEVRLPPHLRCFGQTAPPPNTAMFSVVNAAILQPLGYPRPQQLMFLTTGSSDVEEGSFSPAEYWELADINPSFSIVGAFTTGEANLSAKEE